MPQHPSWMKTILSLIATIVFLTASAWAASHVKSTNKPDTYADTSYEEVVAIYGITKEETETNHATDHATSETLEVEIKGVKNNKGNILVLVFDSASAYDAYAYTQAVGFKQVKAQKGKITVSFDDLKDGPYAIVALHDENVDNELNLKGDVPAEGYGTSGAKSAYDDLSFKEASMLAGKVKIKMFYL